MHTKANPIAGSMDELRKFQEVIFASLAYSYIYNSEYCECATYVHIRTYIHSYVSIIAVSAFFFCTEQLHCHNTPAYCFCETHTARESRRSALLNF